tara:strand:+ start:1811 stop:2128 length:318 start_codon:yes stop_codon:yes gene_type:complete
VEIKKLIFGLSTGIILSGCVQSTAMIGPAITIASTGNISQAGFTFITNKAVEEETGMDTVSYVSNKIEEKNRENKIKKDFKKLIKNNFTKTRKKLISEDQSNIFR